MFARHGILKQLISDNGRQFSATSFAKFAEDCGFTHILTSPRYLQANGEVECAVQTMKTLLKKPSDPYKVLMAHRATPLENSLSLAELLMERKIRTRIPTLPSSLSPVSNTLGSLERRRMMPLKKTDRRETLTGVILQKPSRKFILESTFGYQKNSRRDLGGQSCPPHALTQLKLPREN